MGSAGKTMGVARNRVHFADGCHDAEDRPIVREAGGRLLLR
jgi:hypothetical protein